ncbi:MAG: SPOR domain-containing protein [Pseudomonadota bacterium]
MRNLFLMLLAANLLFFGWKHWVYQPDAGVTVVDPNTLGERIPVANGEREDAAPVEDVVAVDTTPEPEPEVTALPATVGRACMTIGPFDKVGDANSAQDTLAGTGYNVAQRAAQGTVFVGHWVYVDNIPSRSQARSLLKKLQDGGIKEAILMAGSPGEDIISLGLFSAEAGAERTELKAKSMGVEAYVVRRTKNATVFWLDVKLKAGQAGSALADVYGDDRVLRGDAATCPQNG